MTPTLPDDALLQVYFPDNGLMWRVAKDGRWLVTKPGQAEAVERPLSRTHRGKDNLTPAAVARVEAVLQQVGFFGLPARIEPAPPQDVELTNGRPYTARVSSWSAHAADGQAHTVEVLGDVRAPATLGPLGPVYRLLDDEAIGGWSRE